MIETLETTQIDPPASVAPCPFCSAKPYWLGVVRRGPNGRIEPNFYHPGVSGDTDCILSGRGFSLEEVSAWNTRATPITNTEATGPRMEKIMRAAAFRATEHQYDIVAEATGDDVERVVFDAYLAGFANAKGEEIIADLQDTEEYHVAHICAQAHVRAAIATLSPISQPAADANAWRKAVHIYRGSFNRAKTRPYDDDLKTVQAIVAALASTSDEGGEKL